MRKDAFEVSASGLPRAAVPTSPSTIRIILSALPGIAFVWMQLGVTVALLDWSIGNLLLPGTSGVVLVGLATLPPALWAGWRFMRSAIAAERELAAGR